MYLVATSGSRLLLDVRSHFPGSAGGCDLVGRFFSLPGPVPGGVIGGIPPVGVLVAGSTSVSIIPVSELRGSLLSLVLWDLCRWSWAVALVVPGPEASSLSGFEECLS